PLARGRRHTGDAMSRRSPSPSPPPSPTPAPPPHLPRAEVVDRAAVSGIAGLGGPGAPRAMEVARAGFRVLGFDVSPSVVEDLNAGCSHGRDVPSAQVAQFLKAGKFGATADLARLGEPDVVSICVPTPLSKTKDPDVSYVL